MKNFGHLWIFLLLTIACLSCSIHACLHLLLSSNSIGSVDFFQIPLHNEQNSSFPASGRAVYEGIPVDERYNVKKWYLYHEMVTTNGIGRWIVNDILGEVSSAAMFVNSWAVSPDLAKYSADFAPWMSNSDGNWTHDESVNLECLDVQESVIFLDTLRNSKFLTSYFVKRRISEEENSAPIFSQIKFKNDDSQFYLYRLEDKWLIGETPFEDSCQAFTVRDTADATSLSTRWNFLGSDESGQPTWLEGDAYVVARSFENESGEKETAQSIIDSVRYRRSIKYLPFEQEYVTLRNNLPMPKLGYGTGGLAHGDQTRNSIELALRLGYRMLDMAREYQNEHEFPGIMKRISEDIDGESADLPTREDVFVVTKVWPTQLGFEPTLTAIEESLLALDTDYIDLYLIHWPRCDESIDWMHCQDTVDPEGTWVGSWYAFEKAYAEGYLNSIGVSNFDLPLLKSFFHNGYFGVGPHVVQNFAEPGSLDREVLDWCEEHEVAFQPYASLRNLHWDNGRNPDRARTLAALNDIAAAHSISMYDVALRFMLQAGTIPIPRASQQEHMARNLKVFDWELLGDEMDKLW